MKRIEIEQGQRFGRLIVINEVEPIIYPTRKRRAFKCLCDCGKIINSIDLNSLRNGLTKSCGCYGIEKFVDAIKKSNIIHNDTRKKGSLYLTWMGIKRRCYDIKATGYHRYGGRGIKMNESWINDYVEFKKWIIKNLGERPENHTIDRIDNNVGYFPGNLRWATSVEQNNNRRKPNMNAL